MKSRGSPRLRWIPLAALAAALAAVAVAQSGPPPTPISLGVFQDDFNSAPPFATYKAVGLASISISGGTLNVSNPTGDPASGFSITLPPGGTGVRCLAFSNFQIPEPALGTFLDWTWFAYDDTTGQQIVVLQTHIEKTGSITIRHRKANGTLVEVKIPDKSFSDIKTKKWDTRRSGKQVQLEIEWKDGTKYNSKWMDPPASTIAGFTAVGNLQEYSVDQAAGMEFHTDVVVAQPVLVASFATPQLQRLSKYFIGQTDDSDVVVVGRVLRVAARSSAPLGDDPRPRLRVVYQPSKSLRGSLPAGNLVAFHALGSPADAARFRPGRRAILYLQRGEHPEGTPAGWFFDYGRHPGVVAYNAQNLRAVTDRIAKFFGGPNR
jgi:hypothetical protein